MKFRSSSQLRSERLSRLSLIVMALGVAALVAAGVLFGLSATGQYNHRLVVRGVLIP